MNAPPRRTVAPGRGDRAGRLQGLLPRLHRARPGDQPEEAVADSPPADLDDRGVRRQLPPDEPIGRELGGCGLHRRLSVVRLPSRSRDNGAMRIFSGIRASGDKTLGNYSGGYRQYAATQEQGEAVFCIVDLHSITTAYEPEAACTRRRWRARRCSSPPASTRSARSSSARATSPPTRRPRGCSAP